MRRNGLTSLGVAFVLAGCAGTEPVTSETGADQRELMRCASPKLTESEMRSVEAKLNRLAPEEVLDLEPGSTRIRVHAHVIHSGAQGNLTDEQVERQIQQLNYAFGWRPGPDDDFTPPPGPTPIDSAYRFDLVSIDRTDNAAWYGLTPEDADAATELAMKSALRRGGKRDLNIYINAPAGGYLGWATFPWSLDDGDPKTLRLDGVVVHNASIPGGSAPYDQGDSLVHEVGHWLGLHHTFYGGCTGKEDGASLGDFVKDTGRQVGPTWECPAPGVIPDTCLKGDAPGLGNVPDPVENFMDYSPDACMGKFSRQQMLRANRNVKAYRPDEGAPLCGNAVLDEGEACDIRIPEGTEGACPKAEDCADGQACTKDEVIGLDCQQQCFNHPITEPDDGADGCCPEGAAADSDPDCEPEETCGNGVVDEGELCDTAITAGAGKCPTAADCNDDEACTVDGVENEGSCTAQCAHTDKGPQNGDQCCPRGANNNNDNDCAAVCGNGVVEPGGDEECDPPGELCSDDCKIIEAPKPPKFFRVNSMALRDPHVWFSLFGCKDVTDVPLTADLAVNIQIDKQLTGDADGDGNFDMSPILALDHYDPSEGAVSPVTLDVGATCKLDGSGCAASAEKYAGQVTSRAVGVCLAKLDGTFNASYTLPINKPTDQCFGSAEQDFAIVIQGSPIKLRKAQVAAVYETGKLQQGLIRGFLTEADADATTLEVSGFSIVLSSVLAGGKDCCQKGFVDKDSAVIDGVTTPGWWFYLNYTAVETSYR
jgi:hypothetical protein